MRATMHNGRAGKNGVYSPKHNDRQFEGKEGDHDGKGNVYWSLIKGKTFAEGELQFYTEHFGKALELQNEKYRAKGQHCYCREIGDVLRSKKTAPEEVLWYIGNMKEHVSKSLLAELVAEQIKWEQKKYPNVVYLNVALHVDEEGAPHIQARRVFIGHDNAGNEVASQTKAFKEMGVGDYITKVDRHHNAKAVYTAECRQHFEELCRARGIELEPRKERGEVGLSLLAYKTRMAERELKQVQAELTTARQELADLKNDVRNQREQFGKERQALEAILDEKERAAAELKHLRKADRERAREEGEKAVKARQNRQVKETTEITM